jgi:hypothetical protein
MAQFCAAWRWQQRIQPAAPNGGSARGYQAIFVASATLGSPGFDGQLCRDDRPGHPSRPGLMPISKAVRALPQAHVNGTALHQASHIPGSGAPADLVSEHLVAK